MIAFILLEWIWFASVLAILGVATAYSSTGLSVMFGLIFAGLWFWVNPAPVADVIIYGIIYLIVGAAWSVWRYRRYVQTQLKSVSMNTSIPPEFEIQEKYSVRELSPKNSTDRIVHWILIWPFSMIENLTRDMVHVVREFVRRGMSAIYNHVYTSAVRETHAEQLAAAQKRKESRDE